MKKRTLHTILNWLPFILLSSFLIWMGLYLGWQNRLWQIENGYPPVNIKMAYALQIVAYWIVTMFGWIISLPIIWIAVGPHDYHGD